MSGRVANQNAQEFQSPPMLDRRRKEELAVSIGNNIQREEATMAAKIGASSYLFGQRNGH
jgi:hypothetical protein